MGNADGAPRALPASVSEPCTTLWGRFWLFWGQPWERRVRRQHPWIPQNPSPEPCSLQLQTPDFVPQPPKTHPRCLCSPHPTGHPPEGCSARPWCGAWGSAMRSFGDAPMLCSAACSSVPRQRLTKSPRRCLALILCNPLLPFRTANPWLLPPPTPGEAAPARRGGGW